jgi:hypothetical protein
MPRIGPARCSFPRDSDSPPNLTPSDGVRKGSVEGYREGLMMIQGPLLLDWTRPKFGLFPRIEMVVCKALNLRR